MKTYHSDINGSINVIGKKNNTQVIVDGFLQSGTVMQAVWQRAFETLLPSDYTPSTILILGFGASSRASAFHRTRFYKITLDFKESLGGSAEDSYFITL